MPRHVLHDYPPALGEQFEAASRAGSLALGADGATASFRIKDGASWPYRVAITDADGHLIAGAESASPQLTVNGLPAPLRGAVQLALRELEGGEEA